MIPDIQIKRILYATDLSESAFYAFAYAAKLASLCKARLTLLHVVEEDPDLDARIIGYISEAQWNAIKERNVNEARQALIGKQRGAGAIREVLTQFCENAKIACTDLTFENDDVVVRRGNPVEQILAQIREDGTDMVVVGTHGHGTLADAMMGSTARRVLRRSPVPVLTIRLPE